MREIVIRACDERNWNQGLQCNKAPPDPWEAIYLILMEHAVNETMENGGKGRIMVAELTQPPPPATRFYR